MNDLHDRKLLYAIHHNEQYELDEAHFKEFSEFLELKELLAKSHGELMANEILSNQEEELQEKYTQQQVNLEIKQFQQWKFYHGIQDPDHVKNPGLLFGENQFPNAAGDSFVKADVEKQELQKDNISIVPENVLKLSEVGNEPRDGVILQNSKLQPEKLNGLLVLESKESHASVKTQSTNSSAKQTYVAARRVERENKILEELYKLKDSTHKQDENNIERGRD